jgi:plastocyanin
MARPAPVGSRRSLLAAATAVALLLAACPDDAPIEEPAPEPANGEPDAIRLVAENVRFDLDEITVSAGAEVTIELENRDRLPHNFSVYRTDAGDDPIYQGEISTEDSTHRFEAPEEPGTYHFQCDPHPVQMNGRFIVE